MTRFRDMRPPRTILDRLLITRSGRSRVQGVPWILRCCPRTLRKPFIGALAIIGWIAQIIFILFALLGSYAVPLTWIRVLSETPAILIPVRWLFTHFSSDTALAIYTLTWGSFIALVVYLDIVFEYLVKHGDIDDKTGVEEIREG